MPLTQTPLQMIINRFLGADDAVPLIVTGHNRIFGIRQIAVRYFDVDERFSALRAAAPAGTATQCGSDQIALVRETLDLVFGR